MIETELVFEGRSRRRGASPLGESYGVTLRVPRRLGLLELSLTLWTDGGEEALYPMEWQGLSLGCDVYRGELFGGETGLFWFAFRGENGQGPVAFGKNGRVAALQAEPAPWQWTVYDSAYRTPDFIKGGVFYHIFVDRFCKTARPLPCKAGAVLREDWGGVPAWEPDERGEILNNDFFGGSLCGIMEKLPYLAQLGVTCLYLSPLFEAQSNHKYDTGDYEKIDPMFGDAETFSRLCALAGERGISVICDGVFSHTGSDSRYFNRSGTYPGEGAYQSQTSPYYPWYTFRSFPEDYDCWWNFKTLPNVSETEPSYLHFICGENGVLRRWLRAGAAGWRLDVADELPEAFLRALREAVKAEKPNALILGEVWEDASNKLAYGERRHYFQGAELDTVMNYPFRTAILAFVRCGSAEQMGDTADEILCNYPPQTIHCLMNMLGTHDTPRALTALGGNELGDAPRALRAATHMTREESDRAVCLLKLAVLLQMTLPGVPCIYYGDEAQMEGYQDPFNRGCYPWGRENRELIAYYERIIAFRRQEPLFRDGDYETLVAERGVYLFRRYGGGEALLIGVNRSAEPFVFRSPTGEEPVTILPDRGGVWKRKESCYELQIGV